MSLLGACERMSVKLDYIFMFSFILRFQIDGGFVMVISGSMATNIVDPEAAILSDRWGTLELGQNYVDLSLVHESALKSKGHALCNSM